MTLAAVGIIFEIVSAVAVVVSLLHFAIQIRHSALINKAVILIGSKNMCRFVRCVGEIG